MIPPRHPVQADRPPSTLPADVVLRAYEVYSAVYGEQPAMIHDGCRGGFGLGEIIAFLYARTFPKVEWSRRVDEALRSASPSGVARSEGER